MLAMINRLILLSLCLILFTTASAEPRRFSLGGFGGGFGGEPGASVHATRALLERELGLEVRTITSFEHLMAILAEMKARAVAAFVGSCGEVFYIKHRADMERHGVPGVLVDVGSDTCYDLGRVTEAYAGAFEGVTTIRPVLLERVIRACAAKHVRTREEPSE